MPRNNKILLTGGSGFLGKHVQQELIRNGFDHIIIPRSSEYDLTNPNSCESLFEQHLPDTVIHLAATCGGIGANMAAPGKYFYDNMMMGINSIECSRKYGVKKFILVGTVCAYPKYCPVPFREQDIWNGYPEETNAPYGIAKKSLFVMLEAYHNQYGLNSVILIPSNLYGPGDNFNPASSHVIPAIIKKISKAIQNNEKNIEIWGDGYATREFLYAPEAARAIVTTVQKQTGFELINIGSGEEISIRLLVSKIAHIMNYKGDILWDTSKPNGQPRRCVDTSKAQKLLQWSNNIDIDQGLADTIKWYLGTQ